MATRVTPGPVQNGDFIREAVCVHTNKIYDSCRDKDCLEDLRLYPTEEAAPLIAAAGSLRARSAALLYVGVDVEAVHFNRGYYAVNTTYYYDVRADAYTAGARGAEIRGLAAFTKRVMLFGSEGNAKIFSSAETPTTETLGAANLPTAYVEAVDPIVLDVKLVDVDPDVPVERDVIDVPEVVLAAFDSPIVLEDTATRRVLVSLGQFSLVRLERDSQLLIPTYDYCIPEKDCDGADPGDPCAVFAQVNFPVDEFFPPDTLTMPDGYREALGAQGK